MLTIGQCRGIERIITNFLKKNKKNKDPIIFGMEKIGVVINKSEIFFYNIYSSECIDRLFYKVIYEEIMPTKNLFGSAKLSEFNDDNLVYFQFVPVLARLRHHGTFAFAQYSVMRLYFSEKFFLDFVREIACDRL